MVTAVQYEAIVWVRLNDYLQMREEQRRESEFSIKKMMIKTSTKSPEERRT